MVQLQFHFITVFVLCYILNFQTFLIKPCILHKFQNQFYSSGNHLDAQALKQIPVPSNCGITCHNFTLPFCFVFSHVLWMSKGCIHFQRNSKEFWYPVLGTWKYVESEKDIPTCVWGQAKDLTNTLRNVVSDLVYMNENKLL